MLSDGLLGSRRAQWVALVAIWTVLAGIMGTTLLYLRQQVVRSEESRLAEQARIVDVNMQRQLQAVNAGLHAVMRDLPYFEAESRHSDLSRRLQALSDTMVGVSTLSVLDGTGNVLASNRANLVGENLAHRDHIKTAVSAPRAEALYLSAPFRGVSNVYLTALLRVSVTPAGRLHRIVSAILDPEFFEDLLASVRYADDVRVAIAHESGHLMMHLPPRPELLGYQLDQPGSFFRRHKDSASLATVFEGRVASTGEYAWLAQRTIEVEALNMTSSMVVAVIRDPVEALEDWRGMALVGALIWLTSGVAAGAVLLLNQRHRARVRQLLAEKEALRQQAEADTRRLAFYDPLTELPNRRMLADRLRQLQAASLRHGHCSVLLFLDLDGFKELNDTHGHDLGDQLLKEVATRLRSTVREEDTVARWGGDEFVIVLSELGADPAEALEQARTVAGKLLSVVAQDYALGPVRWCCSASIGITLFGRQQEPYDDILKRADHAMYDAKLSGRNAFRLADQHRASHG